MKRLLIVDDEPFIVNGLYDFMMLGSGLELDAYKAHSGDEAVDWLQRTRMDIVISDIRMPSMSGLQLLEQIRKRWPYCKVILLTGYNEFDYIYQAIRYDGVRYLLKTEGYDKILELVREAIAEIDEAHKSEDMIATANRQMKLALPILQKDLLTDILRGEHHNLELRRSQFRQLHLSLDAEREVFLIIGRIDNADRRENAYRVKMAVERYMGSEYTMAFQTGEDGLLVWLVQLVADGDEDSSRIGNQVVPQLKGILELALDMCENTFGFSVHFIVDGKSIPWDQVSGRFAALRTESGSLPVIGDRGSIVEHPSMTPSYSIAPERETLESAMRQMKRMDLLSSFLELGRKDEFLELLEELLHSAELAMERRLLHAALGIYYPLSLLLLSQIHAWHMEDRLQSITDIIQVQVLQDPAASPHQAAKTFRQLAPMLFEWRQKAQISHAHTAVSNVQDYLLANLDKDLSLVRLAEVSRLNPSYLSRLFKQVTGVNLNVYIQDARMNKAMELLRDSDNKVYEIAKLTGYEYPPYFTKIFKKQFGIGPQEYRDRLPNNVNNL
jgi:two-component system response regulator YesN